jgi:autotransporter-associated beta strand protein
MKTKDTSPLLAPHSAMWSMAVIIVVLLGYASFANSQSTFTPTTGSQSWGTAGNWSPSGVPSAAGAQVIFNSPTGTQTVTLSGARTVGSIALTNNSTNTFLLSNGTGGSLTLDVSSGSAAITVGGTGDVVNTISATTTLSDSVIVTVNNTTTTSGSGALTLTGAWSGAGGLTKEGAGTLSLTTAAKTYSGATSVNAGILRVSEIASPSSTSSVSVATGAQLRLDSGGARTWNLGSGSLTLNGTGGSANGALRFQGSLGAGESQSLASNIILASDSSIHLEDGDGFILLSGNISGSGGLIKRGSGTLRLSSASNVYAGNTEIINGAIVLTTGSNRLPTGTTVSLGDSASANLGTLNLNGQSQQIAGLNSTTGTNATATNNTVTSGGAATLTLGGSGTYSYGDGTNANSGIITGAISLVKSGSGTQTLGDANTYSGGTTISGGTLNITNTIDSATGTGNVLIQDTATLQGSGRIAPTTGGTIIVEDGGTVAIGDLNAAPAQGAKVLTITPATGTITTTFETGSTIRFDLFTNAGDNYAIASAADLFRTGGNLTFLDEVTLSVNKSGTFSFADGDRWRLLDWTSLSGSITGTSSQLTLDLPTLDTGLFWDVSSLYTNGSIAVMIPEPSRTLFLALGLLTLTFRRRR